MDEWIGKQDQLHDQRMQNDYINGSVDGWMLDEKMNGRVG